MELLWSAWEGHRNELREATRVLLFSDFDGTLTPIVASPEQAQLSPGTKLLLQSLAAQPWARLAIISGRSLTDLRSRVGIEGIIYAGNHGLEVEGQGWSWAHPMAQGSRPLLQYLAQELRRRFQGVSGVLVEDKGLSLSFHYRMVAKEERRAVVQAFTRLLSPWLHRQEIRLSRGKKVREVRPPVDWDKGRVVSWLRDRLNSVGHFLLYLGDDKTDEDAFAALRGGEWGVWVGRPRQASVAPYFLPSHREVERFLRCLLRLKGGQPCPG